MKEFKKIALTSMLLTLAACGSHHQQVGTAIDDSSQNTGIIGGTEVAENDAIVKTTVGLVMSQGQTQSICTGTLISENVVLTAAHCIDGVNEAAIIFGTDMEKAAHSKKLAPITSVFIHPSYDPKADKDSHDIALVRFSGKLPSGYEPAALLKDAKLLKKGLKVVLAGYGASEEVNGQLSGSATLRKVTIPLNDPNFSKTEIHFDASEGKGSCHGDSGGPAFAQIEGQTYLIGVTSRTTDLKGGCHKDSVYSNVAAYSKLIEQTAMKLQESN